MILDLNVIKLQSNDTAEILFTKIEKKLSLTAIRFIGITFVYVYVAEHVSQVIAECSAQQNFWQMMHLVRTFLSLLLGHT